MDSYPFYFSDEGWPVHHDYDRILHSYETIYQDMEANPVEVVVKEDYLNQLDHDEAGIKPRFFTPPLQKQRNEFVRHTLHFHMERTGEKIRKLAVLGCGSLSLERFLMNSMGEMGIERVLSVDINEHEIAKGLKLLNVEHIPKEDATHFVRSVLLNVQPDLFIISTPNHEYNEAFGLAHGQFRHNDHKFEFSRLEFRSWLYGIISEFDSIYDYRVKYVGNVHAFTRLGGATQFGIIWRKRKHCTGMVTHTSSRAYKKAGEAVLKYSLFILEREKIRQAFILWLQNNKLLEEHLIQNFFGGFWRVDMGDVMQNVELPKQLKNRLSKRMMVDMLRYLCKGRINSEFRNYEFFVNIPHDVTGDELIKIMT